jgi:hypothetical protein
MIRLFPRSDLTRENADLKAALKVAEKAVKASHADAAHLQKQRAYDKAAIALLTALLEKERAENVGLKARLARFGTKPRSADGRFVAEGVG